MKKRGSSHTPTADATKVKKNAHPGSVQNINNTREALAQEGSDQQVSFNYLISCKVTCLLCLAMTVKYLKDFNLARTSADKT